MESESWLTHEEMSNSEKAKCNTTVQHIHVNLQDKMLSHNRDTQISIDNAECIQHALEVLWRKMTMYNFKLAAT
jgi:hypothetical protein